MSVEDLIANIGNIQELVGSTAAPRGGQCVEPDLQVTLEYTGEISLREQTVNILAIAALPLVQIKGRAVQVERPYDTTIKTDGDRVAPRLEEEHVLIAARLLTLTLHWCGDEVENVVCCYWDVVSELCGCII